jgi:hypothetical protein
LHAPIDANSRFMPSPTLTAPRDPAYILNGRARMATLVGSQGQHGQSRVSGTIAQSPFSVGSITVIHVDDAMDAVDASMVDSDNRQAMLAHIAREVMVHDPVPGEPLAISPLSERQVTSLSAEFDRIHTMTARTADERRAVHLTDPHGKAEVMAMAIQHELVMGHEPVRNAQAFLGQRSWSQVRPEVLCDAMAVHRQESLRRASAYLTNAVTDNN